MRDTIFISHATPEDNDFTIWLASRLQLLGYKVWIDKSALVGGEKFWEEIDLTIRNKAAKVLLVYSANICQKNETGVIVAGKLKDGIYKEYSLAESIGKQQKINEFIILLNKDGIDYNLFIGADRINLIPFFSNWAEGFDQLTKKLKKDGTPLDPNLGSEEFSQWFQNQYITPNPIIEKKELYYSNIWPVHNLPKSFYIHQFKTEQHATHFIKRDCPYPLSKISNYISSFEGDLLYQNVKDEEEIIFPERIIEINIDDIFKGKTTEEFPTQRDSENHFKSLLKNLFHKLMKSRGMFWYEMSNRKLAYYYTPANLTGLKVKFEYPYRTSGNKKTKNLIGIYKRKWKWHFALSVKPILSPILGFYLKSHLVFTDDGFKVWKNENGEIEKDKIHSHRRSKGKMFFNEEWRDMFLAFLHGLKNKDGLIIIPLSCDFNFELFPSPEMFWTQFGYYDPKDKTRQGLMSTYDEDEHENDDLTTVETNERT
jgi:hypothetical protein